MKCSKCEGTNLNLSSKVISELAKGSPTKGKNKKFINVRVYTTTCKDCRTSVFNYEELGERK
ncbi:hypothetical protein CH16_gp059 [Escherichia phage KBNP1711]|uniref:Uncharacterized protein n=2 Tax=Nieuwekanaalvirus TaxID=3044774 RepID=A0A2Z3DM51_9CAUD|nr:hypothetical protein CH16_gp059 [Escherichia phage KBNP1711]YP_010672723.1 hypothetical protein PQC40_gp055 [Escherichia phage EP335]AHI60836.1 hypothetical protein ECBP3_0059 [Escherichia phage KBNP1711]AVZ45138.1 hypothetical protein [Escherichia phage EP335]